MNVVSECTVRYIVTLEALIQSAWQHLVFVTTFRKSSRTHALRFCWCLLAVIYELRPFLTTVGQCNVCTVYFHCISIWVVVIE